MRVVLSLSERTLRLGLRTYGKLICQNWLFFTRTFMLNLFEHHFCLCLSLLLALPNWKSSLLFLDYIIETSEPEVTDFTEDNVQSAGPVKTRGRCPNCGKVYFNAQMRTRQANLYNWMKRYFSRCGTLGPTSEHSNTIAWGENRNASIMLHLYKRTSNFRT